MPVVDKFQEAAVHPFRHLCSLLALTATWRHGEQLEHANADEASDKSRIVRAGFGIGIFPP